jgi:hypothetical protein
VTTLLEVLAVDQSGQSQGHTWKKLQTKNNNSFSTLHVE